LERYAKSQRFIGLCAILSDEYFKTYHVSFHTPPAEFFGFLTTQSKFNLLGVENDALVLVQKNVVPSWQDFLERVVEANTRYNTFFLAPTTFYSPMANMLRTPKGHMKLEIGDGGEWQWGRVVTPSFISSSGDASVPGEDITEATQNISSSLSTGPSSLLGGPRGGAVSTSGGAPQVFSFGNMGYPGSVGNNSSSSSSSSGTHRVPAPSPYPIHPPISGFGGHPPSSRPPNVPSPPPPQYPSTPAPAPSIPFEGDEITGVTGQ